MPLRRWHLITKKLYLEHGKFTLFFVLLCPIEFIYWEHTVQTKKNLRDSIIEINEKLCWIGSYSEEIIWRISSENKPLSLPAKNSMRIFLSWQYFYVSNLAFFTNLTSMQNMMLIRFDIRTPKFYIEMQHFKSKIDLFNKKIIEIAIFLPEILLNC